MGNKISRTFRMPEALALRVEAVAEIVSKKSMGVRVDRTAVLCLLIERGLNVVEDELKGGR